jgi:hypothetical protein
VLLKSNKGEEMNQISAIPQAVLDLIGTLLSQPHIAVMVVAVMPWIAWMVVNRKK